MAAARGWSRDDARVLLPLRLTFMFVGEKILPEEVEVSTICRVRYNRYGKVGSMILVPLLLRCFSQASIRHSRPVVEAMRKPENMALCSI
jgi:hypothetical protein